MSHMYPKNFPRTNRSSGEKKVFNYFKSKTDCNWYILHSFRLPEHLKVVFGEADFIVVAPGYGIFTLEIKSGGVGFNGSKWLFIDRDHNITEKQRGPFEQARDGMFEIEKILNKRTKDKYRREAYLYGYGVIFTDEDNFPTDLITEDESWRLMQKSNGTDYCSFVRKLSTLFDKELTSLGKRIPKRITEEEAEEIVNILRPEIECVAPLKTFIEYSEEDLIKLTDEQFWRLEDIKENDRNVILGGAGTGKTILARKEALLDLDAGEKVGVFCYNKNLAKNLRMSLPGEIDVYSFHAFLTKVCGKALSNADCVMDDEFFSKTLPEMALEALKEKPIKYTKIIVDEFQDLCTESYLPVFNELLEGGLFNGRFSFYGDFAKQAIFSTKASLKLLENYTYFAKSKLTINCRNTTNIGNEIVNVTGYEDTGYRLKVTGEPVDYYSFESKEQEADRLKKILKELGSKKFTARDVVILSPKKREASIVHEIDPDKFVIGNIDDDPNSYRALFATAQSFKGLECKIVIITDIENYDDTQLMYVALSRARSKMYVLESKSASKQRKANVIMR